MDPRIFPCLLAAVLSAVPLYGGSDLVLHVGFDGNVDDASATGADGVPVGGLSYTVGVLGSAADFDGVDDAVTFPTFPDGFLSTNDFTIAFWFNAPTSGLYRVAPWRSRVSSTIFRSIHGRSPRTRCQT